jgi:hypothetical protein
MQWEEYSGEILNVCVHNLSWRDGGTLMAKRLPQVLSRISVPSILDWVKTGKTIKEYETLTNYALNFMEREGSLANSPIQELGLCAYILKRDYVENRGNNKAGKLLYYYITAMGAFTQRYYNPDCLCDVSLNALPPDIRAIYLMYIAISDSRATKENVDILKLALKIYPPFHEEIRIVLGGLG